MKLEDPVLVKRIVEAAIMAAEKPLAKRQIKELFDELEQPDDALIDDALEALAADCEKRGYELVRVASGYRFQVKQDLSKWVSRLWKEKAPRYSRALLETLSLIAYRQPITRGEIEDVRGVAVSSQIIKTLLEREWIKVVGHKDVPGRPAIYATTRLFLDYFNLKNLDQLPPLAELRDLHAISQDFNVEMPPELAAELSEEAPETGEAETGELEAAAADSETPSSGAEVPEQIDEDRGDLEQIGGNLSTYSEASNDDAGASFEHEEGEMGHIGVEKELEMHASGATEGENPLNC